MAEQEKLLILYDLAGRHGGGWAPSPWRTRLVLNYKEIPYETKFIPSSQLHETLKATGVPPSATPNAAGSVYTVPMLQFPDGTQIMDSWAIASKLENLYPNRSLHLETGYQDTVQEPIKAIFGALVPCFIDLLHTSVYTPEDEHWGAERAAKFAGAIDTSDAAKEKAWENARPHFERLVEILTRNKTDKGPFVLGSRVSMADFVVCSCAVYFRCVDRGLFERFVGQDESIWGVVEGCEKWLERDW